MNIPALITFLVFFGLIVAGLSVEALILRALSKKPKKRAKQQQFSWGKYIFFLFLPVVTTLLFLRNVSFNIVMVVAAFALMGTLAEWLIGFFYHQIMGDRLWTYHRYSITSYTSFLVTPVWGVAGLIFYLYLQIFIV